MSPGDAFVAVIVLAILLNGALAIVWGALALAQLIKRKLKPRGATCIRVTARRRRHGLPDPSSESLRAHLAGSHR